ncbi:MAG: tetratricopeptide repeat protein [Azonexus sp.]|nr:tetratricopeptide repeat protein [Azonexus sp.]
MGLFDRFRSPEDHRTTKVTTKIEDPIAVAQRLINEGNAIEESGQFQLAIQCYEAAIRTAPDLARAHMNRGNVLLATDDVEGALVAYTTALELEPDYAAAYYNLGHAHLRQQRYQEARADYEKAVQLKTDFVDAYVALGCVLEDLGMLEEAASSYCEALAIAPDYAEVHGNLGNIQNKFGQLENSAASYRKALSLNSALDDIQVKLGQTLKGLNQTEAAVTCFRTALMLNPANSDAHFSLGMAQKEQGNLDDAVSSLRLAIKNDQDNPEKHINLGDIFNDLGQPDNAISSYERALEIKPDHAIAHSNLGNVKLALAQFDGAIECYRQAIEIQPDFAAAHNNLGATLLHVGYPIEALTNIRRALALMPDLVAAKSNLVFIENSIANKTPQELLAEAKRYGEIVAGKAKAFTNWPNDPNPDRCLRIGLVSGDLRDHPVGHFLEGILHSFTSSVTKHLEFYAYTTFNCSDRMSQRLKACCHGWYAAAHVSDEVLANKIREDKIDILIDLSGHTAHNRLSLFAWKPAPIQVTWLGYLATTGVSAIDYLIADAWTLPESEESNFTEKIWRLPESYLCFTPPQSDTAVSALPVLNNGYITFGCFNNLTKIGDDVVALWARILKEVPESRLFLKAKQFVQASVQQKVKDRFAVHGIASERLILMGLVERGEYLVPYQQVDIALDPFPYPGITTSVESLWMGVPVLTLASNSFLSRQGVGLMMNAGLPDWIAHNANDYVSLAKKHAADLQKLSQTRSALRDRVSKSPIFDSFHFTKNFEDALRGMWNQWCSNRKSINAGSSWTFSHRSPPWQNIYNIQSTTPVFPTVAPIANNAKFVAKNLMKLHIGGKEKKAGWKILNAMKFEGVDYLGDVRDLSAFDDASCEKIYASHVMEHVSQKDFLDTLKGIHRILCNGGEFYFSVPDLETLCKLFLNPKLEGSQRFHVMRMIFGGQVDDFDFHFIGLTEEFMMGFFKQAGFSSARRVATLGLFNDTSDYRPYDTSISLNMIAKK